MSRHFRFPAPLPDADSLTQQMLGALPPDVDLGDEREVISYLRMCDFSPDEIAALLDRVIEDARAERANRQTIPMFCISSLGTLASLALFVGFIALICPDAAHASDGITRPAEWAPFFVSAVIIAGVIAVVIRGKRTKPADDDDYWTGA